MITVYMNSTRKSKRVQIQQVQKPQVPYFTYEPPRRFISKINNLRFASSRALNYYYILYYNIVILSSI